MQNFQMQNKRYHFAIEISHCLSNNSIYNGFLPYNKNKIQTQFFLDIEKGMLGLIFLKETVNSSKNDHKRP